MTLRSHHRTNSCWSVFTLTFFASYVRTSSPHHLQFISTRWYTCPAQTSVLPSQIFLIAIEIIQNWSLTDGLFHYGFVQYGSAPLPGSLASRQFQPPSFLLNKAISNSHQGQSNLNFAPPAPMLGFHQSPMCISKFPHRGFQLLPQRLVCTPWLIQTLGHWSSNCYTQYIRTPASILQVVPVQLAGTQSIPPQA